MQYYTIHIMRFQSVFSLSEQNAFVPDELRRLNQALRQSVHTQNIRTEHLFRRITGMQFHTPKLMPPGKLPALSASFQIHTRYPFLI